MARVLKLTVFSLVCIITLIHLTNNVSRIQKSRQQENIKQIKPRTKASSFEIQNQEFRAAAAKRGVSVSSKDTIKIASVVCSKPGDDGPRSEAAFMIKSVIISTILHNLTSNIEFHVFLEHMEDEMYFLMKLEEYGDPFKHMDVNIIFHSVLDAFPKNKYQKFLFFGHFRCMYVRIFFPMLLPSLDSVMYLDTDVLVTGNVQDLWKRFSEMNKTQLIAMAPNVQKNNPRDSIFFKDIPFPKPKGLNSGVLLMNLTKMRESQWTGKLMQIYRRYQKMGTYMNDQKLINILLYYEPELLLKLPCQFNFWVAACIDGYYCGGAIKDPVGIQVIHGANSSFDDNMQFYKISSQYEEIELSQDTNVKALKKNLMEPIRRYYRLTRGFKNDGTQKLVKNRNKCDIAMYKLLFKRHFPFRKTIK